MAPPLPLITLGGAEVQPAPPLDPHAMDALLRHRPGRAAAVLLSMRPTARHAQLHAHAALADAPPARIQREWGELLRLARPAPPDDPPPAAPIEPETLALAEPDEARRLIAALSPTQRVRQAVAQAAWLNGYGYPVDYEELLTAWEADAGRAAA